MKRFLSVALLVPYFAVTAADKDPAKLKNEFAAALPAGNMAQVAWTQQNAAGGKQIIHVVSSLDGIIHEVTSGVDDCGNPQITDDGTMIVYEDYSKGNLHYVNWDGTNDKIIPNNSGSLQSYWYDAANKVNYAVTYQGQINIVTGNMNKTWPGSGDDGLRISPDGKYVVAGFNGWQVYEVATGKTTNRGSGGCVCNLSPDNLYSVMVQQSGHQDEGIMLANGSFKKYPVIADIRAKIAGGAGCGAENGEFQETRWVHPEYVTFAIGELKSNPFLVNIYTPTKWVAMQDDIGCLVPSWFMCSSVDARIVPTSTATIQQARAIARTSAAARTLHGEAYLPNGRRINPSTRGVNKAGSIVRGVVISTTGVGAAVRTIVSAQ